MTLIEEIRSKLAVLEPSHIEIRDDSALHKGHAGNTGGGHFQLIITSAQFKGLSQVMRHRQIYSALSGMIPTRIHALSIQAYTSDETSDETSEETPD